MTRLTAAQRRAQATELQAETDAERELAYYGWGMRYYLRDGAQASAYAAKGTQREMYANAYARWYVRHVY